MHPSGVCSLEKKLPSDRHSHLGWESFTELLSNMKYGKNNVKWQTSIKQKEENVVLGIISGKEKEALRVRHGIF